MMDTMVTESGRVQCSAATRHDPDLRPQKTCGRTIRRMFSSEFLEHQLLDFIISTFCIPLL